ncbi:hypothetical protein [Paenibacillus xerothermodurans]|uniref:Uncharacterized protein n=1 Tax=Paenibacillus xerothermodurans TaxID=1977292 RepID=A0A2W1N9B1_PAEXE|nr:hypothetical protein [Paenibacillus xerothermodurans]PZE20514.1 hypothetical protein CBW46_012115 [Paenibacillus xerothermodurans]
MTLTKHGCPLPEKTTLAQRLQSLIGGIFRVELPGGDAVTGFMTEVHHDHFVVQGMKIYYATSFYIYLNQKDVETKPYDVSIDVEAIGSLQGQYVRSGKNFIEINQGILEGTARVLLFPINQFVDYHCTPSRNS